MKRIKERRGKNQRRAMLLLMGIFALSGIAAEIPLSVSPFSVSTVMAADRQYNTQNGTAAMGSGVASITVAGNKGQTLIGKKFNVYKLFYAENAKDGESINYTFNPLCEQALKNVVSLAMSKDGKQVTADQVTEYMAIDYIQTLNTNPAEGARKEQTPEGRYSLFRYFVEDVRDELVKLKVKPETVNVNNVRSDNTIRLSGLDYGYYIIDEVTAVEDTHSASSLCMVDTANPTASIAIKSDYPGVTKKIQEDDDADTITDKDRWNDVADFEIGQRVPYKYESNVPDMNGYQAYYYAWHDRMDSALTFNRNSVKIVVTGKSASGSTKDYTLKSGEYEVVTPGTGGDSFLIMIKDLKAVVDREFNQMDDLGQNTYGQSVILTYDAVLNDKAAQRTGRPGFENDVRLEFSNDADSDHGGSTGFTPWDTVVCYTYKMNTQKMNDHDKTLEGAKFRLYSDKDCKNEVYVKQGEEGYLVMNRDLTGGSDHTGGNRPSEAAEMVSQEEGMFTIFGLDSGTYYLKETDAPDGYRQLKSPIVIEVRPTFTDARDSYVKGEGATDRTLKSLEAFAHMESFYEGLTKNEDKELHTDVAEGSMNLTVINQVGKKLPVTGTPAVMILIGTGVAMMAWAIGKAEKRKVR